MLPRVSSPPLQFPRGLDERPVLGVVAAHSARSMLSDSGPEVCPLKNVVIMFGISSWFVYKLWLCIFRAGLAVEVVAPVNPGKSLPRGRSIFEDLLDAGLCLFSWRISRIELLLLNREKILKYRIKAKSRQISIKEKFT